MSSDLSVPRSPGSDFTADGDIVDRPTNGLHLELAPFGLEHIYDYEKDGHHPVHLGDLYGSDGQYRVIHKLGSGGFATVWLCRDIKAEGKTRYVALKILMAETSGDDCPELRMTELQDPQRPATVGGSGFISLPLSHFKIQGPNGDHLSFVYPVLGPKVSLGLFTASTDPDKDLRSICLQVTQAVEFLHSQNICHGNLTPNNVLHLVTGLDGLNEEAVLQILGTPVVNPVLNKSQEPHRTTTAPEYLVYPVEWSDIDTGFISRESCVIDFGESFNIAQPPVDLGTPGSYRAPELILEKKAGLSSDLWALGCTLFEIRTGRKLFSPFDDEDDDYLDAFVQVLGRLPEPWWSTTWKDRRIMYKDEVDENGLVIDARAPEPAGNDQARIESIIHPSVAADARSLKAKIAAGLWYMSDRQLSEDRHRDINQKEQEVFADLLGRLLEYKPEARISAEDATRHEWFRV